MNLSTTLLAIEYEHGAAPLIPETPVRYSLDEAVSAILSGEPFGSIKAVYSVSDGMCVDVSNTVADRIVDALIRGDFVSPVAREFVNFMSRDLPGDDRLELDWMERAS